MGARRPDPSLVSALGMLLWEHHRGVERMATGRVLMDELAQYGQHVDHIRRIGEAVDALLDQGLPVVSSSTEPRGYCLAERPEDGLPTIRQDDHRITKLFRRRQKLKRALARLAGPEPQLGLFPGGVQ